MLVAIGIQPRSFIDSNRVNDEFVAFPTADRMTHPLRVLRDVVRMLCSVGINNPEYTLIFKQNGNHVVGLYELKRSRRLKAAGGPDRQTKSVRIVGGIDVFEPLGAIGSKWNACA